jgi:hypothetical protein
VTNVSRFTKTSVAQCHGPLLQPDLVPIRVSIKLGLLYSFPYFKHQIRPTKQLMTPLPSPCWCCHLRQLDCFHYRVD